MAYIGLVEYDQGGRVQSLDGLAAVSYDNGRTRNLLGANLGAVKYDDGGRFRTLVGLGQDGTDVTDMLPPDVGVDTSIPTAFPISYSPPSIAPSALPYIPSPVVDTTSTPTAGTLVDTTPAAVAPAVQSIVPGVLTSIFSGVKSVFSSTAATVKPAGNVAAPVATSWFSQGTVVSGLPNWAVLAGAGVAVVVVMASLGGGSRRRRNPSRKNPAELILMGANPRRYPARIRRPA